MSMSLAEKFEYQAKVLAALEQELAALRAKAKAYNDGQEAWGLFDAEGEFAVTCPNEQKHLTNGWTCRKVRVCKEVVR